MCAWNIVCRVDLRTSHSGRNQTVIPDTRESRQQHSTRSSDEARSESPDGTHTHEIPVHSRLGISEFLTVSAVKTDVNPSDIGTKALGRERFYRMRSMFGVET